MDLNIAKLVDMGFLAEDAEEALSQFNDFNYALSALLANKKSGGSTTSLLKDEDTKDVPILRQPKPGKDVLPPYNTFTCMVDLNLPLIHIFPRNFFQSPLITVKLPKMLIVAHHDLELPSFSENKTLCPLTEDRVPIFPEAATDYVCKKFNPGSGRAVTKMEIIAFPFGFYDGTLGRDNLQPLVDFGDARICIRWDFTATPQFIMAVDVQSILSVLFLSFFSSFFFLFFFP